MEASNGDEKVMAYKNATFLIDRGAPWCDINISSGYLWS